MAFAACEASSACVYVSMDEDMCTDSSPLTLLHHIHLSPASHLFQPLTPFPLYLLTENSWSWPARRTPASPRPSASWRVLTSRSVCRV